MEEHELYKGTCRVFNDLAAEGRSGDRLFICTRPLTLKKRGVCPAHECVFSEGAIIDPSDIDVLLGTGEIIEVGVYDGRAVKFHAKYRYLAKPPKPKKKEVYDE